MDQLKGSKKISLFSSEGKSLITSGCTSTFHTTSSNYNSDNKLCDTKEETEDHNQSGSHCNSCHVTFTDREDQVEHYQLDWHRHNLKRKLRGLSSLTQDEFERLSDDLSSISGSNSETEEEEEDSSYHYSGSPLLSFTADGSLCAVYKVLITNSKDIKGTDLIQESLINLTRTQIWIILMKSGGHFAGAVFKDSSVIDHKTFHRYTVRAKRGTIQSSRDSNQGGHKPRSAGASLRRYNEAALEQEIDDLILSWKDYIKEASIIFVRAPKHSKHPFTTGKHSPLTPGDPRIRHIPFVTRRPTFHQVKSVHLSLATVYCGVKLPVMHHKGIRAAIPQTNSDTNLETHSNTNVETHSDTNIETHSDTNLETHSDTNLETHSDTVVTQAHSDTPDILNDIITEEREEEVVQVKKKRRKAKEKKVVELVDPLVERLHYCCMNNDVEHLITLLRDMKLQQVTEMSVNISSTSIPSDVPSTSIPSDVPSTSIPSDVPSTSIPSDVPSTSIPSDVPSTSIPSDVPSTSIPSDVPSTSIPSDVPSTSIPSDVPSTSIPSVVFSTSIPSVVFSTSIPSNTRTEESFHINSTISHSTPLHVASSCGHVDVIRILLLHGADPVIKDGNGKLPYALAKDRATRDCFRRFMSHYPLVYDYVTAQIPSPLSEELEESKKGKKAEKKRQQRKAQKERKKESKMTEELKVAETKQQQALSGLSEREKRALAAEKRMISNNTTPIDITRFGLCSWCQSSLCGVVPFERLQYKYCKIECVKEHRQFLANQ